MLATLPNAGRRTNPQRQAADAPAEVVPQPLPAEMDSIFLRHVLPQLPLADALSLSATCATLRHGMLSHRSNPQALACLRQKAADTFHTDAKHFALEGAELAVQLQHLAAASHALRVGQQPFERQIYDADEGQDAVEPVASSRFSKTYLAPGGLRAVLAQASYKPFQLVDTQGVEPCVDLQHPNRNSFASGSDVHFSDDASAVGFVTAAISPGLPSQLVVRGASFATSTPADPPFAFLPGSHRLWFGRCASEASQPVTQLLLLDPQTDRIDPVTTHPGVIGHLAIGRCGQVYAATVGDAVRIYARSNHAHLRSLEGSHDAVRLLFSPDDSLLAAHTYQGGLRLLSVEDGRLNARPVDKGLQSACFSSDSRILALGMPDHVAFYDTQRRRVISTVGSFADLSSVAFSFTGDSLRVGCSEGVKTVLFTYDPF